ncbi:MAG: ubiquinone/menaquinone biosynthesis methyltransferase, partial [FCB group bacterium]|nr:ubiquinone/menaquinone biosynthesis methyltransferase [FCB group bacterium]
MFNRIAHRYDLLNRLLSMRQDVAWRKRILRNLPDRSNLRVLDVATGTADVLLALAKSPRVAGGVGLDMSEGMLAFAQPKLAQRGLGDRYTLVRGDGTRLPFATGSFDIATIAFGIRNVPDVPAGLSEMRRILAPGGRAMVLEFSLPGNALFRRLYLFYFRHILPRLGGMISGDAHAYRDLNQTVETFPYGEAFAQLMRTAGFRSVT